MRFHRYKLQLKRIISSGETINLVVPVIFNNLHMIKMQEYFHTADLSDQIPLNVLFWIEQL